MDPIFHCRPRFQHYVTSTITTVFSAFSSFGLAAVSAWFASERMVFNRHKGKKWLAEILDDASEKLEEVTGYRWVKETAPEKSKTALSWSARVVQRASVPFKRMGAMFGRTSGNTERTESIETIPPPYTSPTIPPTAIIMTPRSGPMTPMSPIQSVVHSQLGHGDERSSGEASGRPSDATHVASPITSPSTPEPVTEVSATRARFMNLVRSAVMVNRLIGVGDAARAHVSRSLSDGKTTDRKSAEHVMPRSSRVAGLVPKLQNMTPTQDIAAHAALVRHMQVSVNPMVPLVPSAKNAPSSPQTENSWPPPVGTAPRLYSTSGYVAFTYSCAIKPSDLAGEIHFPSYAVAPHRIHRSGCMVRGGPLKSSIHN